ncbi:MAG TPA: hypothetical protein VIF63_01890, partial [Candidatus Limnocylindrales bacterium]
MSTSAPQPKARPKPSPRRLVGAAVLDMVLPGLGHLSIGRRRTALLFFIPVAVLAAGLIWLYLTGGFTAIVAFAVTP